MPFFPVETYTLQYVAGQQEALHFLRQNTKESALLATVRTDKRFIGTVANDGFRLISSVPGIGAFTVLTAGLTPSGGRLTLTVNKPFRVLMGIIAVFFIATVLWQVITHFELKSIGLVVPALMFYFFGRFALRRAFKTSASLALEPLYGVFVMKQEVWQA